jgi:competence ComEA-like helix-hairpin-helix protein
MKHLLRGERAPSVRAGGAIAPGVVAAPVPSLASVAPAVAAPLPLDAGSLPLPVAPAPSPNVAPPEHASTGSKRATPDDPVDLNSATVDDLRRLPGIGQKRASAILAVRARLGGRFRQIEDLLKVKGVGRAALRKLHPLVRLDSPVRGADGGA